MTTSNQPTNRKPFLDMSWEEIDNVLKTTDVALVTVAQVAQHGPHLPVATDVYQLREVARRTVDSLRQRGLTVVIGPEIPFGNSPTHLDFPGYVNLEPETLTRLVVDIGRSLIDQGFQRLILLNGAGGNWGALESAAYYLHRDHDDAKIFLLGWFETMMGIVEELFGPSEEGEGDGHGGAWETSCILATAPHLVDMDKAEEYHPDLAHEMRNLPMVNVNWNDQARLIGMWRMQELTETGAWGYAPRATAEAGAEIMNHASSVLVSHIAKYVFGVENSAG